MPLVNRFCIAVVIGCTFATLTLSQFSSLKAAFGQEANNQASQPFFVEGTKPLTVFDAEARLGASLELTAGESRIRIYDLTTGMQKQNVVIKGASERLLAIAPDATSFCILTRRGLEVWSCEGEPKKLAAVRAAASSGSANFRVRPAGTWPYVTYLAPTKLLTLAKSNSKLQLYNLEDGKIVYETEALDVQTSALQLSPDKSLFYYSFDPNPPATGARNFKEVRFLDTKTGKQVRELKLIMEDNFKVFGQTLSPDGSMLVSRVDEVVGANTKNFLGIWDAKTGRIIAQIPYFQSRADSAWPNYQWLDNQLVCDTGTRNAFNISTQSMVARWKYVEPRTKFSGSEEEEKKRASILHVERPLFIPYSNEMVYQYRVTGGYAVDTKNNLSKDVITRIKDMKRQYRSVFLAEGQSLQLADFTIQGEGYPPNFKTDVKAELGNALGQSGKPLLPNGARKIFVTIKDLGNGTIEGKLTLKSKSGVWFHDHYLYGDNWEKFVEAVKTFRLQKSYLDFQPEELKIDTATSSDWVKAHELKMADVVMKDKASEPEFDPFANARDTTLLRMPSERKPAKPWGLKLYSALLPLEDRKFNRPIKLYPLKDGITVKQVKFAIFDTAKMEVHQVAVLQEDPAKNFFVDRFNLERKRRVARTPVPKDSILLDILPNATSWLICDKDRKKLQVFACKAADADSADTKSYELDCGDLKISSAYLAPGGRVVTMLGDKVVEVSGTVVTDSKGNRSFTKPSQKVVGDTIAVYQLGNPDPLFTRNSNVEFLTVSPVREVFVDLEESQILFLNTKDGSVVQQLNFASGELTGLSPEAKLKINRVDFRFDGKDIAITNGATFQTGIWDLTTGKFKTLLARPAEIQHWAGDFLMSRNTIFHIPSGLQIWRVIPLPTMLPVGGDSPDPWYLQNVGKDLCLIRHPIPGKEGRNQFPKYVKKAGIKKKRIGISVDAGGNEEFANKVKAIAKKRLTADGFEVLDAGLKVTDPIMEIAVVMQGKPKDGDFTRQELGFQEGEKSLLIPDRYITADFKIQVNGSPATSIAVFGRRLSAIDYKINWDSADPEADLLQQFEADVIKRLETFNWGTIWIPNVAGEANGRNHVLGESTFVKGKWSTTYTRLWRKVLKK